MNNTRLKDIREENDLTQKEVAEVLLTSRSTYAGWENDLDSIPLKKLIEFCNFFKLSIDYVLKLSDNKYDKSVNTKYIFDNEKLSANMKETRIKVRDTQRDTAKKLNTSQSNYCNYENSNYIIITILLKEFAIKYNKSIDWLLGRK